MEEDKVFTITLFDMLPVSPVNTYTMSPNG